MVQSLVAFTQEYIDPAVDLFIENYKQERTHNPLLPARAIDEPGWIREALESCLANPGVAVVEQGRLLAYMVTGAWFPFKGQRATLVPEYAHSAVLPDRQDLYQRMYLHLAQEWANAHSHLHIVGHFAHDAIIRETLYQLGFGAILTEGLRDLSPIAPPGAVTIVEEHDVSKLVDLQIEHARYYPKSPIFILKPTDRSETLAELAEQARRGDAFFVYDEEGEAHACMIVGESASAGEGFLLQNTNTAQIKSAYSRVDSRGKGVGKALLQAAVRWAQQHGYERVFVEHETANYYGGKFWDKYFAPYLYISMRYIDQTI